MLTILPCSLEEGCKPIEEVKRFFLQMSTPIYSVNVSNYENPTKLYTNIDDLLKINPSTGLKVDRKLMKNQIKDYRDNFFFMMDKERVVYSEVDKESTTLIERSSTQIKCTKDEIIQGSCKPYYQFNYAPGGKQVNVTRSYKGIMDTLGAIGGMGEIVYLLFYYVYYWFNLLARKKQLLWKIYGVKRAKNRRSLLCCKRNKSNHEFSPNQSSSPNNDLKAMAVDDEHFDFLYKTIMNRLDIINIVKEINALKSLTRILLTDEQIHLMPVITLSGDLELFQKQYQVKKTAQDISQKGQRGCLKCLNRNPSNTIELDTVEPPCLQLTQQAIDRLLQSTEGMLSMSNLQINNDQNSSPMGSNSPSLKEHFTACAISTIGKSHVGQGLLNRSSTLDPRIGRSMHARSLFQKYTGKEKPHVQKIEIDNASHKQKATRLCYIDKEPL